MKAWGLAIVLAACEPTELVTREEVIVGLSPSPAEIVADGVSTSVVTVQTVSEDVKSGLEAKLTLVGASWFGNTGQTIEKELGPDGLITATVLASRVPGEAQVIVEVAGYERDAKITLRPAEVKAFLHTRSGGLAGNMGAQLQLTVQPVVSVNGQPTIGGLPSAGTAVAFETSAQPAETAYLTTSKVVLDAGTSTASTTIVAGSTTTSVTIMVSITPPGQTNPTATGSIVVDRLP